MNRRPGSFDRDPQGSESTRGGADSYHVDPAYTDAYTDHVSYPPTYDAAHVPSSPNPGQSQLTEPYWLQGQAPPEWLHGHPPGEPPEQDASRSGRQKSPRWLWIAAVAAVLLVVALVIALVIADISAKKETAVPPLPAMPGSKTSAPSTASSPTTTSAPTTTSPTTSPGATDAIVYNVTGEGRAISISYVDDDGVMQIEFNVALPWSKEVSLPKSGGRRATVTIVNIGNQVTCSVTVAGVQVRQHSGVGLTVCDAAT